MDIESALKTGMVPKFYSRDMEGKLVTDFTLLRDHISLCLMLAGVDAELVPLILEGEVIVEPRMFYGYLYKNIKESCDPSVAVSLVDLTKGLDGVALYKKIRDKYDVQLKNFIEKWNSLHRLQIEDGEDIDAFINRFELLKNRVDSMMTEDQKKIAILLNSLSSRYDNFRTRVILQAMNKYENVLQDLRRYHSLIKETPALMNPISTKRTEEGKPVILPVIKERKFTKKEILRLLTLHGFKKNCCWKCGEFHKKNECKLESKYECGTCKGNHSEKTCFTRLKNLPGDSTNTSK